MGIGILNDEAAYSMRRAGRQMKPDRRSVVVEVEVKRFDSEPCEQSLDRVGEARKRGPLDWIRASEAREVGRDDEAVLGQGTITLRNDSDELGKP